MPTPRLSASLPKTYAPLLAELKSRVRSTQISAALAANAELVQLYWHIGHLIFLQQRVEGWGTGVITRLAADLQEEFPDLQGFSVRNLKYMLRFAAEYGAPSIVQQPAAQLSEAIVLPQAVAKTDDLPKVQQAAAQLADTPILPQLAAKLPWFHHVILLERVKNRAD
eukprot:gene6947-8853_t